MCVCVCVRGVSEVPVMYGYRWRIRQVKMIKETDCISYNTNKIGKCRNPIIAPLTMGKQWD